MSAPSPIRPAHDKPSLAAILVREPWRFEFFQAVRLLERMTPDRKPVGYHVPPREEVSRFKTHVSHAFPASELYDIAPAGAETPEPTTVTVAFMGLAGAMGVLPRHYTSLITDPGVRRQVTALADFLDLFNHRFVSLFYRAWEKYRFPVAYERRQGDRFSLYLFCLIGMGTEGLRGRLQIREEILLYYAGLLSKRPRAASALEGILEDYFGVPVDVEQFTGEWFFMNPDALTALGPPGQNDQLGVSATLWARVWDPQARFRVTLGPLTWRQFVGFLPDSVGWQHLVELTRFFVGEEFNFEVRARLRADQVPATVLGGAANSRLGWATWLRTDPLTEDTMQPVFEAHVVELAS